MGYPSLPVETYRQRLKDTVALPHLRSIVDDPNTPENERRTYCNLFVRTVVRWFGFEAWKKPEQDGERASEIITWMKSNQARWTSVDFPGARDKAVLGHLVIAGQVYTPSGPVPKGGWAASGHVCIVAPEPLMHTSGTFGCKVPMVANVGAKVNTYGTSLSLAFKPQPPVGCWLYTGQG